MINHDNRTICFIQNNCFTFISGRQLINEFHLLAIGTVSYILMPFAVITNTILLMNLRKNKTIPMNFRRLLQILASADLLVGLIVLPMFATMLNFYGKTCNCAMELICQFVSATFAGVSGRTTGMIAIDRFIHIKYYNFYPLLTTTKYKLLLYSASITLSMFSAVLTILGTLFGVYPQICAVITSFDMVLLVSVVFLYLSAWRSVNRHVRTSIVWKNESRRPRYNLLFAKKVTGILIILNICYGPFVITNFMRSFYGNRFAGSALTSLNLWSYNIVFGNSVLNAVVLLRKDFQAKKSSQFNQRVLVQPGFERYSNREHRSTQERPGPFVVRRFGEIKSLEVGTV